MESNLIKERKEGIDSLSNGLVYAIYIICQILQISTLDQLLDDYKVSSASQQVIKQAEEELIELWIGPAMRDKILECMSNTTFVEKATLCKQHGGKNNFPG